MRLVFELALGLCTVVGSTFGSTVLYQLPVVNAPTNADGYERMYVPSFFLARVDIDAVLQ